MLLAPCFQKEGAVPKISGNNFLNLGGMGSECMSLCAQYWRFILGSLLLKNSDLEPKDFLGDMS